MRNRGAISTPHPGRFPFPDCENVSMPNFEPLQTNNFAMSRVRNRSLPAFLSKSGSSRELRPQRFQSSQIADKQSGKPAADAAHITQERLPGLRLLPLRAKVRLWFSRAIKHSILQESLPTLVTSNRPEDTALAAKSARRAYLSPAQANKYIALLFH